MPYKKLLLKVRIKNLSIIQKCWIKESLKMCIKSIIKNRVIKKNTDPYTVYQYY